MEAKQYIRTYEELKSEKNTETVQKKAELEKKWIKYYKDVDFAIRKMTKKQKAQLKPFQDKALKELKGVSTQLFTTLTQKKEKDFNRLFTKETSLFFKKGTQGLVQLVDVDYHTAFNKIKAIEDILSQTGQEWAEKVKALCLASYETLQEAYQVEQQFNQLFSWWAAKKDMDYYNSFTTLCAEHLRLTDAILQQLGYGCKASEVFKTKGQKTMLRQRGFLQTLQDLEGSTLMAPLMERLLNEITFLHPKEEFRSVREMKRHFILHIGPTNSGKTYHAIEALKKAESGIYLAPIRLLALEIQEKLLTADVPCTLITGEEEHRITQAKHQSSTIEITNFKDRLDVAVIDEVQMIQDPIRGSAWLRAIFGVKAKEIHLCGAPHSLAFMKRLIEECGDSYEVRHYERQTELIVEEGAFSFPHDAKKGDALIVFSKRKVLETAHLLKEAGYRVSMLYGKLPSELRKKQVALFASGETDILVTTDAIGIGLNLPIERIVFLETQKFDGKDQRYLTTQEVKQIAGRAGRKGLYEKGYVSALENQSFLMEKLTEEEKAIQQSILAPNEKLLDVPMGTLRHRLHAWQKAPLHADYLQKADITRHLMLLKYIEKWEHELGDDMLLKTLYTSFDSENKELLYTWISYVEQLKDGKTYLDKPKLTGKTNTHLETYYQQLNLYQQFGKKFRLRYASDWVQAEKQKIAQWMGHNMTFRGKK